MRPIARFILHLLGWSVDDAVDISHVRKAVVIIAPHTSNWDWFYWILMGFAVDKQFRYLLKKELYFRWRPLMQATGAIPVMRGEGMTAEVIRVVNESDTIFLAISPEGVLPRVDTWRTGFYVIATETDVPIIPVYVDYATKTVGYGEPFHPTGDIQQDIVYFREFYSDKTPRKPDQFGNVAIRD